MFKRERSRYSIRKNKCYGACSVFLGLTILTLAMAGGNVKAEEVGASNTPTSVEQPAAEVTENTSLVNTDNSSTETDQPASNSEEVTTLQPRAVAPANLVVENMEPKDVSDKIQVLDGKFLGTDKPIDPNQGQNFDFETHFYVGKDVNPKDIFYIKLSDNVSSFGDDSATIKNVEPLVDTTGDIIATGVANAKEKNITYTFTDAVANKNNIIGHIKFPVFIERNKVLQNENVNIEVVVGNSSIVDKVDIRYTTSDDILSVITSVNKKKDGLENNFETTFYINDGKQTLKNGRVELYPYNLKEESPSSVDFSDLNNITYLLYRVPLNYELPPSFGVDFSKLGEPIPIEVSVKVDNKGREYLNFELPAMTSDRYVLTVKAPYKDNDSDIDITGVLYGGKETSATISTHVLKEGVADASTEEAKGYFFEKHIYQTEKLDGQFITNFEEITNLKMGSAVEKFTTQKSNRHPDYQLYAVTSDTKTHFKGDGSQVSNNFINNTTQEVTYYYKKKEPQPLGTVIVRHVEFGTGKELVDSTYADYGSVKSENGNVPVGTTYTTTPKTPLGYELVERPLTESGEVKEGITRLEYLYKARQPLGTVIVRHIEFGTGKELAPSEYATYDDVPAGVPAGSTVAGTGYETKPAQIDGYDLVEVPEDNYGNVFEGITRLTYVYKKQAQPLGTVIVRHVEFGTGKELAPSEYATYDDVPAGVPSGSTVAGTGYETKPAQIDGYDLIEVPEDDYGNVFEGITRLTYVYKKQAQPLGTVIVRHIEFGTGKELAPSEYATYDDVPAGVPAGSTVAGTGYETKPAQIDGYDLVEVPEDDYGNVFEGITRLTYVYKKQIITGQGEIIDFELESNGDESGQNEQPDEISDHGPLVELEYPSQEGMSGENAGTVEIEENAPIVELDYPSQEGMSGENAGTVEIEESSPIVELDYPSQEGMSGENAGTVEVEENAPIVELDYPSQEGMSGENAGTVEIEESSPIVELDYPSQEGMSGENAGTVEVEENAPIVELDYPSQEGMSGENTGQQTIEEDTPTVTIEEKPVVKPVSSQPSKEELPATGERSETAVTVLGLALSALGLTFIRKRKQN
ncbi:MucBP domain-containing protein [Streptococcus dysgalactiae subsp. equisimilis]|uniref:MucBP domain-containing protein n=2 Tax=Streptococcus dysgalactiae TaxID=1334 RepID=UPI001E40BEC0|nr:MucBP domain-containing protein [Streptococcus dysgalactiae]MCY7195885.1 MucBP domain-containing protein [Streptococcus dysgalactiae]MCY7199610.1 MucBP domain-containing protein [Streptococcus dysgalactiae]MCY7206615.1 MucBP domain-containing protein [Streptococcus dysgalactiae]WHM88362.1 MucBP domain-containing protein [Streptococcus dysgalactiae subsp. equisimilis]